MLLKVYDNSLLTGEFGKLTMKYTWPQETFHLARHSSFNSFFLLRSIHNNTLRQPGEKHSTSQPISYFQYPAALPLYLACVP